MQKLANIYSSNSLQFRDSLLLGVCYMSLEQKLYAYMHQLCFIYMLNYPVIYSLSAVRERVAVNVQGTVYQSKIENSS